MSNPILENIGSEGIIEADLEELYKLGNVIKFTNNEIIPILEGFENGFDLKFNIRERIKNGGYKVHKTHGRNPITKKESYGRETTIGGKRFDPFYVIEEEDKRVLELKYALIKILNKEERIVRGEEENNSINLSLGYVLEEENIKKLIAILELLEKFGYNIKANKERVMYGINLRFYIKNLWNGYYNGVITKEVTKTIKKQEKNSKKALNFYDICYKEEMKKYAEKKKKIIGNYHYFLNEKENFEDSEFEKELIDRRDLAKATIIQALNSSGDLIEASGNEEVEYGN